MMDYLKIENFGLEVHCRVLNIVQDRIIKSFIAAVTMPSNQIVDVEYVELEPDPDDAPAPMASLVYNPKK